MEQPKAIQQEDPNVFADLTTHEDIRFLFNDTKKVTKAPVKLPIALRTIIQNESARVLDFRPDTIKAAIHTALNKDQGKK